MDQGEGYMSHTDTIDMRLSALDQHVTNMYREYLESVKKKENSIKAWDESSKRKLKATHQSKSREKTDRKGKVKAEHKSWRNKKETGDNCEERY